ncbi:MAG: DUF4124 domain-containing protein [Gammaproteobacteria bacterium]|nr:DUF4124 domain-containing protein [Gammaproteobacteria bacterium]
MFSVNTIAKSIYECKDSSGNIIYTDDPKSTPDCTTTATEKKVTPLPSFSPPNNAQINKPAASRLKIRTPEDSGVTTEDSTAEEAPLYSQIVITSPKDNETVNSCGGVLDVNFTITPNLFPGDLAVAIIDGQPYGEPTTSNTVTTTTLERGTHTAAVQIVRNNQTVKRSPDMNFMFMRNCAKKP